VCVLRRVTCEANERASESTLSNHSSGIKIITAINPGRKGRMVTEGKDVTRAERRKSEKGCKVVERRGEGEGSGGLRVARGCGERQ